MGPTAIIFLGLLVTCFGLPQKNEAKRGGTSKGLFEDCVCNPTLSCPGVGDGSDIAEDIEDVKTQLNNVVNGLGDNEAMVSQYHADMSERLDEVENAIDNLRTLLAGSVTPECPSDFTKMEEGGASFCFKLVRYDRISWEEAQMRCHAMGDRVRVLVLDSLEKYNLLVQHQSTMPRELGPWVGAKRLAGETDFYWQEAGNTRLSYDAWWTDEPDSSTEDSCVNIYCNSSECGLWDADCASGARDYYCEKY